MLEAGEDWGQDGHHCEQIGETDRAETETLKQMLCLHRVFAIMLGGDSFTKNQAISDSQFFLSIKLNI